VLDDYLSAVLDNSVLLNDGTCRLIVGNNDSLSSDFGGSQSHSRRNGALSEETFALAQHQGKSPNVELIHYTGCEQLLDEAMTPMHLELSPRTTLQPTNRGGHFTIDRIC
jgi:hypothetical protein